MQSDDQDRIYEEAVRWHARLNDADMAWEVFGDWLDADPAHQAVYDRLALLDDDIGRSREQVVAALPANDREAEESPTVSVNRWWTAGGIAAAIVIGAVTIPTFLTSPVPMTDYATGPSEMRTVALRDGSSIRLDRNTRLAISDNRDIAVRLDGGAAFFDVRHDPSRAFTVTSGSYVVRDVGTRFDVSRQSANVSVAVESGLVNVAFQGGAPEPLAAGQQLTGTGTNAAVSLLKIDPASVGSWRNGRLIYDDVPLSAVVADLSRYSTRPVLADPSVANLRLSAILIIGDGSHLVDQLQAFLPLRVRRSPDRILLVGVGRR